MLSRSDPTGSIPLNQGLADAAYAPILVPNVLSAAECEALIAEMVKYPPEPTLRSEERRVGKECRL